MQTHVLIRAILPVMSLHALIHALIHASLHALLLVMILPVHGLVGIRTMKHAMKQFVHLIVRRNQFNLYRSFNYCIPFLFLHYAIIRLDAYAINLFSIPDFSAM